MNEALKVSLIVIFITFIGACGNINADGVNDKNEMTESERVNGTATSNEAEQKQLLNQEDNDYMKGKMETLPFSEIEVEVKYADNKEYEFQVEQDQNEPIEVELDNELANVYLKGRAAFDVIYPNLEKLNIKSDTPETEIIDAILTAFDLPSDYVKVDVEITFNDGIKIDFDHRK